MSDSEIRVLVVDDHTVVREGLQALLETESDITVVGSAADGEAAVTRAQALAPDVVLMDLVMPRVSGLTAIQRLREDVPCAGVLVLTSYDDDERIYQAIEAGAVGYLLKDVGPHELIKGIREVHEGTSALDPDVAQALVRRMQGSSAASPLDTLTGRERDVLARLGQGESNHDIARGLEISEPTVRTHVSHVLRKLSVSNRTQAALIATNYGLASSD